MNKTSREEPAGICPCGSECAIERALAMVGGRWKLRLLCTLMLDGTQRYNDLKKKTAGITPAMLSSSLRELERDALVTRVQYEQIPPRVEYTITEKAIKLWPILHRLIHWSRDEEYDGDSEFAEIIQHRIAEVRK